ncbi:acetyl-CoA carboxylase biotin carboxyl carrier protein subunit, partial [Staphylococcus epidermidis]|nr:acetyl-CoA carboxylase biotin carboxyl carrier protein subunit [Staphylococcus epidermidis]
AWKVVDGDEVKEGDVIAVMEAMKMEMQVSAHKNGRITLAQAASAQALGAVIADSLSALLASATSATMVSRFLFQRCQRSSWPWPPAHPETGATGPAQAHRARRCE